MDDEGNTLLHLAVGSDESHSRYENPLYKEFIELLLDEGANSSAKNNDGLTPIGIIPPGFYHFMQPHHSDILKAIIEILEEPRLNRAVRTRNTELVKKYITEKDSLESRGKRQATPLYYAAYNVAPAITKLLLENGAEVNALDYQGETPLHTAVYHTFPNVEEEGIKVIKLLIENGSDVNRVKKFPGKITPLDFAKDPNGKIADLIRKHGGKTAEELKAEQK